MVYHWSWNSLTQPDKPQGFPVSDSPALGFVPRRLAFYINAKDLIHIPAFYQLVHLCSCLCQLSHIYSPHPFPSQHLWPDIAARNEWQRCNQISQWGWKYCKIYPCGDLNKNVPHGGWRDGSVVKSTDCTSRGPEFNSQQPHGGSQSSLTGSYALLWSVCRQLQCSHIHKINK